MTTAERLAYHRAAARQCEDAMATEPVTVVGRKRALSAVEEDGDGDGEKKAKPAAVVPICFPETPAASAASAVSAPVGKAKLIVLLDKSGSMSRCWAEARDGYDKFLADQKAAIAEETKQSGKDMNKNWEFHLVTFNDKIHGLDDAAVSISDAPTISDMLPAGGTRLYDALDDVVHKFGKHEDVTLCVISDGNDTDSRDELSLETFVVQVERCRSVLKWTVEYDFIGKHGESQAAARIDGSSTNESASVSFRSAAKKSSGSIRERSRKFY